MSGVPLIEVFSKKEYYEEQKGFDGQTHLRKTDKNI